MSSEPGPQFLFSVVACDIEHLLTENPAVRFVCFDFYEFLHV